MSIKSPTKVDEAINREAVIEELQNRGVDIPRSKIPLDYEGDFVEFPLYTRKWDGVTKSYSKTLKGFFHLKVRKGTKDRNHRLVVLCDCNKEVPIGRLHQHVCKGSGHNPEGEQMNLRDEILDIKIQLEWIEDMIRDQKDHGFTPEEVQSLRQRLEELTKENN